MFSQHLSSKNIFNIARVVIIVLTFSFIHGCVSTYNSAESYGEEVSFNLDEAERHMLAHNYLEAEKSYTKAISASKKSSIACSLAPDCTMYTDVFKRTMALLLSGRAAANANQGNNKAGISDAELALEYNDKDPYAHYIMAFLYYKENRTADFTKETNNLKRLADNRSLPEETRVQAQQLLSKLKQEKGGLTLDKYLDIILKK